MERWREGESKRELGAVGQDISKCKVLHFFVCNSKQFLGGIFGNEHCAYGQ